MIQPIWIKFPCNYKNILLEMEQRWGEGGKRGLSEGRNFRVYRTRVQEREEAMPPSPGCGWILSLLMRSRFENMLQLLKNLSTSDFLLTLALFRAY